VKENHMDATDVAQRYFDAWNRRDPGAIFATFAEGGTYTDPNAPEGLSDRAIAEYAAGLFAAFPDLTFDVLDHNATGDGTVATRWLMRGTNTGPFRGNPPTGATVALPGADFIAVEGDKVRSVEGYFDRADLRRAARAAGDRAAPLRWAVFLRLRRSHPVGQAFEAQSR